MLSVSDWLAGGFTLIFLFLFLGFSSGVIQDEILPELKKWRAERKRVELADIQIRILGAETSIILMIADVRSMEAKAGDHGSDPWQSRRAKRWSGVNADRDLLARLEDREKELKNELGIS